MKLTHYIYISTALAALAACSDDDDRVYTVGEADNTIVLQAGAYESGENAVTRAAWDTENDNARHKKHQKLENDIKLALQVSGTWTGHEPKFVVKETTATVGDESSTNSKHNKLSFSPQLYWDDYGTADPGNAETGRLAGLTIYGVGVNDKSVNAPTPAKDPTTGIWNALEWNVGTADENGILDQSIETNDWTKKDLIISNNVQPKSSSEPPLYDGALKFDEWRNGTGNDLLEFKHAMSKITINLMANDGFPSSPRDGKTLVGNTPNKFEDYPTVELLTRDADNNPVAYAYIDGSVNIITGQVNNGSSQAIINTKLQEVHPAWGVTDEFKYTVQMTALVFPGTQLGADPNTSEEKPVSDAEKKTIAKITVDGNVLYVNAQKISEKMGSVFTTEAGKNYILNIKVNKTSLKVEATVAEWIDVVAAEAEPKIDVYTNYGEPVNENAFGQSFSLYKSESKEYAAATDDAPEFYYGEAPTNGCYPENRWYNASASVGNNIYLGGSAAPLYWPDHQTKYFFRGVFPRTKTDGTSTPAVTKFTASDDKDYQGIKVANAKYDSNLSSGGKYPSDLMIGIPTLKSTETDDLKDEPEEGISATEGKITLNFTYRMAQVEVHLMSSGAGNDNNIDYGSKTGTDPDVVTIPQAKVEIVNGYKDGYILLGSGNVAFAKGTGAESYEMNPKATDLPTAIPTSEQYGTSTFWSSNPFFVRHDAVIPQSLTGPEKPLQFKITTYSADGTEDHYYINIKDIKVSKIGETNYPSGTLISAWEPGKHYVYTLNITKTQVTIEATIQDWIPVYAEGDFWLGGGAGSLTR